MATGENIKTQGLLFSAKPALLQHVVFPASYQRDSVTGDLGQLPFQCEMYTTCYFWSLSTNTVPQRKAWTLGKDHIKTLEELMQTKDSDTWLPSGQIHESYFSGKIPKNSKKLRQQHRKCSITKNALQVWQEYKIEFTSRLVSWRSIIILFRHITYLHS